jgi:hypothetical protein
MTDKQIVIYLGSAKRWVLTIYRECRCGIELRGWSMPLMGAAQRVPRAPRKSGLSSEVKHIPEQHQVAMGHSRTFPSKLCGTTVPQPQIHRILCRYVGGASVRQIAKVERRDRATVSKIVKSEDMTRYVTSMRERFFALADDAITSVQKALQAGDAELLMIV